MELKVKTKYELDQLFYVMYNNEVTIGKVTDISISHNYSDKYVNTSIKYLLIDIKNPKNRLRYYNENEIFRSKKELLESL